MAAVTKSCLVNGCLAINSISLAFDILEWTKWPPRVLEYARKAQLEMLMRVHGIATYYENPHQQIYPGKEEGHLPYKRTLHVVQRPLLYHRGVIIGEKAGGRGRKGVTPAETYGHKLTLRTRVCLCTLYLRRNQTKRFQKS